MVYQLYNKNGYGDKKVNIYYGSDGTICEVDGDQIESWKQLPSGKWIKPEWVPGEVVHRTEGLKMLMVLAQEQEEKLLISLLHIQELSEQDSSEQIASNSSYLKRGQPISSQKPYQVQHQYAKRYNQNPSQLQHRQQQVPRQQVPRQQQWVPRQQQWVPRQQVPQQQQHQQQQQHRQQQHRPQQQQRVYPDQWDEWRGQ